MKSFSSNELKTARETPLAPFLLQRGYKLKHEGDGNYRVIKHQGLIVKDHYWYQHSTAKFGNAIDFLIHFENMNFKNSIYQLTNIPTYQLINLNKMNEKYLKEKRFINSKLIDDASKLNLILSDSNNNVCFINYDMHGNIKYIFRRSTCSSLNNFKGEVQNSDKSFYSFELNFMKEILVLDKQLNFTKIIIVEGAIDAFSVATMMLMRKTMIGNTKIVTTAGSFGKQFIERIKSYQTKNIIIATDMDKTGRQYAKRLNRSLNQNYHIQMPEYQADDPNDLLIKFLK